MPVFSAMLSSWRAVEVKPLGPVQAHDPPEVGCGPRSTAVVVEVTVAVDSSVQVVPPFTEMNGVIAVGVQTPEPVTVSKIDVLAVRLPEVPVMVTVEVPVAAELLAVKVSTLLPVVGLVPNSAVTPLGKPEEDSSTLPLNPSMSVTVIVSVALEPCATDKVDGDEERVKLGFCPTTTVPELLLSTETFSGVSVPFEDRYS